MQIDLTEVVRKSARDRWNERVEAWNTEYEFGLKEERKPEWEGIRPIDKHMMLDNELFWLKPLIPHLTEAIVAPIRAKIEAAELLDPDTGEFIAEGHILTNDLRELIGEPR